MTKIKIGSWHDDATGRIGPALSEMFLACAVKRYSRMAFSKKKLLELVVQVSKYS
jgi:hypothetical protein